MAQFDFALTLYLLVLSHRVEAANNDPYHTMLDLFETAYRPGKGEKISTVPNGDSHLIPQVQTSSGLVHGLSNTYAHSFYAIPYAVPPVGDLRFKPPIMLNTPDVVRNLAAESSTQCPQPRDEVKTEDCLVLNVHVPLHVVLSDSKYPPLDRLPVLFFIHGGAFFFGSGTQSMYDGRYLSNATDAIVVTINYRLGPLGFLVFADGTNTIAGNQGLKDQQLALQWMQNNIEQFGGNKSKVTIFGESAGAQSVMFHLLSKTSEPMFQHAVMESNPARYTYPTREEALEMTDRLVDSLRCKLFVFSRDCCQFRKDSYTCLMKASADKLITGMKIIADWELIALQFMAGVEPFRPYIDGEEFKMQPMVLFKEGHWNKQKPIIIGYNEQELELIQNALVLDWFSFRILNRLVFDGFNWIFGTKGKKISNKYEETFPNIRNYGLLFGKEMSDLWFACPNRALAQFAAITSEVPVYYYVFDHPLGGEGCEAVFHHHLCGHSYHTAELCYIFRTLQHIGITPDREDIAVSNQLSTYLGNFAWTGNPSGNRGAGSKIDGELQKWTAFTPGPSSNFSNAVNIRITKLNPRLEENSRGDVCVLWDTLEMYPAPLRHTN